MNCCDDYGQCQRGPNCPAGQAGTATAGALYNDAPEPTTHAVDKLVLSRGEEISYALILLAMVLITLVLGMGVLGYGLTRWGSQLDAALMQGLDAALGALAASTPR